MKQIQRNIASLLTALALAVSSVPLYAGDSIEVPWNQLCRQLNAREVAVTTTTGETVDGYCITVDVNQVSINVKGSPVKIARTNVARLLMFPRRHQLRSLGHGVLGGLKFGFNGLLTPAGPAAVIAIPATLAWGASSLPFCALGDLKAKLTGTREIRIK